jgi:DNA-binding HxlR family transcriptional regulator
MVRRSYGQFCPIAYSLDLIGDRWTLLIVREMSFGPRRFTDLYHGLPGIGKNLLSKRLKDLEAAGVVRQRQLPPPTPIAVYELTDHGQGLKPILDELSHWGLPLMASGSLQEDNLGVVPLMNALHVLFDRAAGDRITLMGEFHVEGEVFHAQIQDGALRVVSGSAEDPDFIVQLPAKILIQLVVGSMTLPQALKGDQLQIRAGGQGDLSAFLAAFVFPPLGGQGGRP